MYFEPTYLNTQFVQSLSEKAGALFAKSLIASTSQLPAEQAGSDTLQRIFVSALINDTVAM